MTGDYAQTVAASIVKQLEDGTAPWVKPWEPSGLRFIPYNAISDKDYQGGNAIWLMAVAEMKGYCRAGPLTSRPRASMPR